MADFTQTPAELNVTVSSGDDLLLSLEFSIDLTGYTFLSNIVVFGGTSVEEINVTEIDLVSGRIDLSVGKATIESIGAGTHSWYLTWSTPLPTSTSRKVIAGKFKVV